MVLIVYALMPARSNQLAGLGAALALFAASAASSESSREAISRDVDGRWIPSFSIRGGAVLQYMNSDILTTCQLGRPQRGVPQPGQGTFIDRIACRDPDGTVAIVLRDDRRVAIAAHDHADNNPRGEPELSISEIRASLAELAPGVPLVEPVQLSRRIEETTWAFGLFGRVFTAFGAAALLMSVAGLYGVIAFNVRQRRREMGTRLALGADPAGIVRLSMRDGAIQVGVGLLVGSSLGLLVAEALQAVIFDVGKLDVQVYAVAIGTVILAGLTASFIPARTASRLDPQTALRPD